MQHIAGLGELIASHPFTSGLEPRFLNVFESCASLRRFSSHQSIFQEGGEADHFYLIVSGTVNLETVLVGCSRRFTIQKLGTGDALGWSWMFSPYQWSFSAVTSAPTDVISFGAGFLRETAARDSEFGHELLRRVCPLVIERLRVTRKELVQMAAPVTGQVPGISLEAQIAGATAGQTSPST